MISRKEIIVISLVCLSAYFIYTNAPLSRLGLNRVTVVAKKDKKK